MNFIIISMREGNKAVRQTSPGATQMSSNFAQRVFLYILLGILAGRSLAVQQEAQNAARGSVPIALREMATNGLLLGFHSIGEVPLSRTVTNEFVWHNDSTEPLLVREVSTSCDCVQVASFPRIIQPGEEGSLVVVVHARTAGPSDWVVTAHLAGAELPRLFCISGTFLDSLADTQNDKELIPPSKLLRAQPGTSSVTFVDVRSQDVFRSGHIPGSINLPLSAVKSRGFLRTKRLVLLNEGHSVRNLVREAQRLKEFQFESVSVLQGGLRAWQLGGGGLEGEATDSALLGTLTASQFAWTRDEKGWLVLAVGADSKLPVWRPLNAVAMIDGQPSRIKADLVRLAESHRDTSRILLVTSFGEGYRSLGISLRDFDQLPVFYLEGGADAYSRYVAEQITRQNGGIAAVSSLDASKRFAGSGGAGARPGGCGGCGRR